MTGLALPQRRKATTYGKSARKAVVTSGSAFARIAATDIWDTEEKPSDHKQNTTSIGRNYTLGLTGDAGFESSGQYAIGGSSKAQEHNVKTSLARQHRSTSIFGDTSKNDSIFDVPATGEDEVTVNGSRKRRKITPSAMVSDPPYVYDDASLQNHVAAEASSEAQDPKRRNLPEKGDKADTLQRVHRQQIATREGSQRYNKSKNRASLCQGADDQTKQTILAKHPRPPTLKTEVKDLRGNEQAATPVFASNVVGVYQSSGVGNGTRSFTRDAYPPSTPPRSTKSPEGVTTPRQRELWNRLLTDGACNASPSNLGLPGLILTDAKHKGSEASVTARKVTWDKAQDIAPKTRPRRLVDTLSSADDGLGYRDGKDSDHESESIDSDIQSSSIQSETSGAIGAVTVQTSPSADSQNRAHQPQEQGSSHASQPLPLLHGVGLKVTYARQRSYLTDDDLNEVAMLSVPAIPEPSNTIGDKRKGLGNRPSKIQSAQIYGEDIGDIQDSQSGTMRSIHELREAGGNVRLVSELEAMLDDIDEQQPLSATLRRSRLNDLVTKLQDPSICRIFIDQGLESRLLAHVSSDDDLITDSLLAAAILQLLLGPNSSPLLTQLNDRRVIKFLIRLLGCDVDLKSSARLREYRLSKFAQQEYRTLCDSLLRSTGWRAGKPAFLSCHMLALQCLEYLVRQAREAGSLSEILSAYAISRVVSTSIPSFSMLSKAPSALPSANLELALSILESCTISNAAECEESLWAGETLERIVGLLPLLASWDQEEYSMSHKLTLRLYLNLTNNSPGLCEDLSTPDIMTVLFKSIIMKFEQLTDPECDRILVLDLLILSLGCFINLAESSEVVRRLVWKLQYDSNSYLDILLGLYMTKSKCASEVYSEEETSLNVPLGYLTMLLGFLCLNNVVKARVSAQLPGGTLKQLVDAVEEFLHYHKQIDRELHRGDREEDPTGGLPGRLQGLVDDLRE